MLSAANMDVRAQNPYLNSANAQLRSIFSQITYPSSDVKFLYERSAKLSDSTFYQNNSADTLDFEEWLQIYDEMYYAAHDTLPLISHVALENYDYSFSNDTIPIGILDYDWYYCANNSLNTNVYFNFDTTNNIMVDKPGRPGWPFGHANIFAVAPLRMTTNFINPTFRVDPNLFLSDAINSSLYNSPYTIFRMDFGDGTGWHHYDPNIVSHYQANFSTIGDYVIKSEILGEQNNVLKSSFSVFSIKGKVTSGITDEVWDMPGMNVGVFHPCNPDNEKVIIYLEGIDVLDFLPAFNRGIDEIYEEMIKSNSIAELLNFNYSYYVVDWKNSRIDMRFNALHLVNLIEKLKNKYDKSDEQFVIIGESMGGLVGRYALTYMETKDYIAGIFTKFFVEAAAPSNAAYIASHPYLPVLGLLNRNPLLVSNMHKTRELITLDTPHQGANIPISMQILYRKATVLAGILPMVTSPLNIGLESYAAKQMLLYHMDGKIIPLSPISGYLPAPQFATFFGQLALMGNYPKFAKLMALSNGALDGSGQLDESGNQRIPNDVLFHFGKYKSATILSQEVPLFDASITLYTNPNGSEVVFNAHVNGYAYLIGVHWFGIHLISLPMYLLNDTELALNVKPYCVSAGGNLSYYNILNNDVKFGFIPVQSALDYGNLLNLPLNYNIQNENITTKLSRTPFDVVMGYADGRNYHHLNYRDEEIFNITRDTAASPCENEIYTYYDALPPGECIIKRSILNLEIGDEEMYIENWTLNRPAVFQAEYDIRVNERNPYYEYPSTTLAPILNLMGVYSKEKDFQIVPVFGQAKFSHNAPGAAFDSGTGFSSVGFSYANPVATSLWGNEEVPMDLCNFMHYSDKSPMVEPVTLEVVQNISLAMDVYPNPSEKEVVYVKFQLEDEQKTANLKMFDLTGKLVNYWHGIKQTQSNSIAIPVSKLEKGIYFFHLMNDGKLVTERLIIK